MLVTFENISKVKKRGLLLFSGGYDSTLSALILKSLNAELTALVIEYDQRPSGESIAASALANQLEFQDVVTMRLPLKRPLTENGGATEGWQPYRNLLFFAIAAHICACNDLDFIAAGHEDVDALSYGDASVEFFHKLADLLGFHGCPTSCAREIQYVLPLVGLENQQEYRLISQHPHFIKALDLTWSCWRDSHVPCGSCFSCLARIEHFSAAKKEIDDEEDF